MSTEAMKLALEALERGETELRWQAITALREALAQERSSDEQPVPPPECKTEAEKTAFAFGWFKALESARGQPAQRTWVGLTDEEREALWYRFGYMELMRAIEAKLKEKNK
jgi:hypothetical protein